MLNKFPIVQHIKFGSLLRLDRYVDGQSELAVGSVAGPGKGGRKAGLASVPKFGASPASIAGNSSELGSGTDIAIHTASNSSSASQ